MKFAWALLIAAAVGYASGARIVGGEPTTIDRYPSIVQVEFRSVLLWSQSCAASILTSKTVLSAAHCFAGLLYSDANRRIRAGTTNRNSGGTIIAVSRRINHPSYGTIGNDGDISVIILQSSLVMGSLIQQVPITPQGFTLPDNLPVVHAGWGTTSSGGSASSVLRHVEIYTINNEICRQRYASLWNPQVVTENMICAGILDVGGKDACQGDSGGPLYYDGILVAVVSWGRGCADSFYPGVSTAVSSYTEWIVANAI